MADGLTKRQREILDYIMWYIEEHGYQPSYRDIGKYFGIKSTRGVSDHIEALRRKGYLDKDPSKARSMEVKKKAKMTIKSRLEVKLENLQQGLRRLVLLESPASMGPMFAATGAATPQDWQENKSYHFDANLVKGEKTFIIHAQGDSMINAHIQDGDLLLVDPDYPYPKNSDIIVARLGEEATVKRYFREGHNLVRLQPENPAHEPIYVKPEDGDFAIVGKVVGIYRQM